MCLLCTEMTKMNMNDLVRAFREVADDHKNVVLDKMFETGTIDVGELQYNLDHLIEELDKK